MPFAVGTIFTARETCSPIAALAPGRARCVDQVALRKDDEVGAGDLILEDFLDRIVMIQRCIPGALRCKRVEIGGDLASGEGCAVHHGHHAVDRHAALHGRPLEGLDEGLGQREAGGLDDDVVDPRRPRQDLVQRRHEIVGHRAADAAIRQFDDVLLRTGFDAAAPQDLTVDADIAEFVDDQRQAFALWRSRADGGSASSCRRRGSR